MKNVTEQKKARLIISFELPENKGYEECIRDIGREKNYTNIYGEAEESVHQLARRIFIDLLTDKKNGQGAKVSTAI